MREVAADDDEWEPQWPQFRVAASEYWRTFHLDSVFIVRSDHRAMGREGAGQTYVGGLVLTSYHLCGGGKEGGRKRKVISGLSGLWRKARPFTHGIIQCFQIFWDWGRRHKARINSWQYMNVQVLLEGTKPLSKHSGYLCHKTLNPSQMENNIFMVLKTTFYCLCQKDALGLIF
jgi:hypothetical protein